MRLKAFGQRVKVMLNRPELTRLAKAREVLENIAALPCDQQEAAKTTAASIAQLAESLAKPDTLTASQFLAGQQTLPGIDEKETGIEAKAASAE